MAGMVAASGPGDLAYGLRIAAERIPARLTPSAEARARAELGIASRRLADLDRTMRSQDQELDERTVSALLVSVEAAAEMATSLSEPVRTEVAARVAEQAELLGQLKRFGAPRTGGRNIAGRIRASLSRGRTRRGRADITHTTTGGAAA